MSRFSNFIISLAPWLILLGVAGGQIFEHQLTVRRYRQLDTDVFLVTNRAGQNAVLVSSSSNQKSLHCIGKDIKVLAKLGVAANVYNEFESRYFVRKYKDKIEQCQQQRRVRRSAPSIQIYPGTKWCGLGNQASNYSDLGEETETDRCCREHDYCAEFIKAGETKYGYKNTLSFTLNSCTCDDNFYFCLKDADTDVADKVGHLFYDVIRMQCFQRELVDTCVVWRFPRIWCKSYARRYGVRVYNPQHWTMTV